MTLSERIGQILFVGIPGPTVDAETRALLREVQPGGVILFARNLESPRQVAELNAAIRATLRIPPIISIDQEGGPVDRLKKIGEPMPAPGDIRATDDAAMAGRFGSMTAEILRNLGFNMNFAPMLDLEVHPDADNALKGRYFGSTTSEVIRFAGSYLEGLQQGGVIACGKHFPGLGDSFVDSHKELPTVERDGEVLRSNDLRPYAELITRINSRLGVVMVAHAYYPAFDGTEKIPASLSPNVVTTLLRDELDFRGLAISDDMEMGAITEIGDFAEACVLAVEAGNDMLLVCQTSDRVREAREALIEAAESGRISPARRKRGLDRIARVKSALLGSLIFNEGTHTRLQERMAQFSAQVVSSRAQVPWAG
ncbi:MAG TPA: beta-N-acetylhexosaminidase [Blastocatellia bacterium]|nr:beta-N-acetylhexosaminidase [Blastocatellia bacterium]